MSTWKTTTSAIMDLSPGGSLRHRIPGSEDHPSTGSCAPAGVPPDGHTFVHDGPQSVCCQFQSQRNSLLLSFLIPSVEGRRTSYLISPLLATPCRPFGQLTGPPSVEVPPPFDFSQDARDYKSVPVDRGSARGPYHVLLRTVSGSKRHRH